MSLLYDRLPGAGGPLSPGHKLGRYEIMAKLASGGMAVVYVAKAQGLAGFERLVALKVLHANLAYEEEFIGMFLDEARLAARIRHPNVVATIDISDSAETGYFLVMEYVEGDHLGGLLAAAHKAGERLPLPVILRIVVDALSGLSAAHDLRDDSGRLLHIVHRDVSPHNILVGRDGVSRLTDFGVAKAEDRLTHTRDGQVKGKLAYMAPEQASTGTSDSRSDLFSMGIILWECLTGRRLFRADNTAATLTKLLSEEVALPSAIDPELALLDPVLQRALDRDPARRFQTAEEFIEAIERASLAIDGLAERRVVSRAVTYYAAERIARDRKRIAAARRSVHGEPPPSADAPLEVGAAPEVSLPSSSLSRSKPSGLVSATAPGRPRRRSVRPTSRPSGEYTVRPGALKPPPPLGSVADSEIPDAPPGVYHESENVRLTRGRGGSLFIALCIVTSLLALGFLLLNEPLQPAHKLRPAPTKLEQKAAEAALPVPPSSGIEAKQPIVSTTAPVSSSVTTTATPEVTWDHPAPPTPAPVSLRGTQPHGSSGQTRSAGTAVSAGRRVDSDFGPDLPAAAAQDLLPNPYKR